MCVYFSLLARGMSGCLFVFAYSFCYSFIASAVYAGHCVCLFHWSLGVCRAVRSFSLILSVIHSLLALCMRGTVCVYFIARPGYVGLFVYFRFRFILFIHCSHCICEAVLVYILFLARGMSASACVYIFIHKFVLLAPQSLICRQCMCHIICLKFCVFYIFSYYQYTLYLWYNCVFWPLYHLCIGSQYIIFFTWTSQCFTHLFPCNIHHFWLIFCVFQHSIGLVYVVYASHIFA